MASLVIGGLFNAVAFAGAGFLFSKLNHNDYSTEMERHNKVVEKLSKAKELWEENEIKHKDRISELRMELSDANADINTTNKALDELRKVQRVTYEGREFTREPQLVDYYTPSDEMEDYQQIAVVGVGISLGLLASRVL